MATRMTSYTEACERVKLLKQEFEDNLNRWLSICDSSTDKAKILVYFKKTEEALQKLNDASWVLAKFLGKKYKMQDDFVVKILGS